MWLLLSKEVNSDMTFGLPWVELVLYCTGRGAMAKQHRCYEIRKPSPKEMGALSNCQIRFGISLGLWLSGIEIPPHGVVSYHSVRWGFSEKGAHWRYHPANLMTSQRMAPIV